MVIGEPWQEHLDATHPRAPAVRFLCAHPYHRPFALLLTCLVSQVVHIDMYDKPSVVPRELVNYHPSLADTAARPWRTDIKPLHVVQPEVWDEG